MHECRTTDDSRSGEAPQNMIVGNHMMLELLRRPTRHAGANNYPPAMIRLGIITRTTEVEKV